MNAHPANAAAAFDVRCGTGLFLPLYHVQKEKRKKKERKKEACMHKSMHRYTLAHTHTHTHTQTHAHAHAHAQAHSHTGKRQEESSLKRFRLADGSSDVRVVGDDDSSILKLKLLPTPIPTTMP